VNLIGVAGILATVPRPRRINRALEIIAEKRAGRAFLGDGVVTAAVFAFFVCANFGGVGISRVDLRKLVLANRDVLLVRIVDDAAISRARRALASVEAQSFDLFQIVKRRFWIVIRPKQTVDQQGVLGQVR
jgi:hypothetical protein